MKLLLFSFSIFLGATISYAQQFNTNTNQWIDYAKTYYKIKVAEDGIYQINYETLKELDIPIETITGNQLCLINEGEEVPLFVSNNTKWQSGDFLQFYGEKLDGEFDKRLFKNASYQLHSYWSLFTDTATYFLTLKQASSKIIEIENDLTNLPEKENYFKFESVLLNNKQFSLGREDSRLQSIPLADFNNGNPRIFNSHFASYGDGEGFLGNTFVSNTSSIENYVLLDVPTPSIFNDGSNALIQFKIVGQSDDTAIINDHHFKAYLNDSLITNDYFEGYANKSYELEVPLTKLDNESTQIKFEAAHAEARVDRQTHSFVKIEYPRNFNFSGIHHFAFNLDNKLAGNYIEFENLLEDQTYWLFDLTSQLKLQLHYDETMQVHKAYLPAQAGLQQRQLILQKENTVKTVNINSIQKTTFTNYDLPGEQGNYIIITHPKLLGNKAAITQYASYRNSEKGGNYQVIVANIEELYDQYSFGIRKHPLAIKYFINNASKNWERSPEYCFLLGKGIRNSRARLNPDNWVKNLVPTFGDSPSDQYFGAAGFDPLSDIAIGRLSATTEADILNYLDKIKQVEQNTVADCNYINEGKWKHHQLQVVGGNNIEQQTSFAKRLENHANIAANKGDLTANSSYLFKISANGFGRCAILNEGAEFPGQTPKDCFGSALEMGLQTMSFLGHSNSLNWEVDIGDPTNYTYNNRYPIMISQASFCGDVFKSFASNERNTLPEIWLQANEAGATAHLGFTYLYEMLYGADFIDEVYHQMYVEKPLATLGQQINSAIHKHYDEQVPETVHVINQFVFSGDPALRYAFNHKPELAINVDEVDVIIEQVNNFSYAMQLKFDFERLNIPADEAVPYTIYLSGSQLEEVVAEGALKDGESVHFQKEFTLLSGEQHLFSIKLDAENKYNEICEDNNSVFFKGADYILNNETTVTNQTSLIKNYPNPFDEQTVFNVTLSNLILNDVVYLSISNLNGQEVIKWALNATSNEQQITWQGYNKNGNPLPAGVYWYQLKTQQGKAIGKADKLLLF